MSRHGATLPRHAGSIRAFLSLTFASKGILGTYRSVTTADQSLYTHQSLKLLTRQLATSEASGVAAPPPGSPDSRQKVIVLTGATAVGKTKASIELAQRIGGEIISADSVQVYKGLDVGSDKVM